MQNAKMPSILDKNQYLAHRKDTAAPRNPILSATGVLYSTKREAAGDRKFLHWL